MAKKEKRISINALERVAKEQYEGVDTVPWFDIEVSIKRSLPLMEMMEFSRDIVEACFTKSGDFVPEIMDFAIKQGVLTRYANFTLPDNLEKQYWLIYNTDAFDMVLQSINRAQLTEITNAANRKLKYLCDSDIIAFRSKMAEFVESLNKTQRETANMVDGLSSEDVQAIFSSITNGNLSEEKIVDAYMDRVKRENTTFSGTDAGEANKVNDKSE